MPKFGSTKTVQVENSDSDSTMVEKPTARKVTKLYSCPFNFSEMKSMCSIIIFVTVMQTNKYESVFWYLECRKNSKILHDFNSVP